MSRICAVLCALASAVLLAACGGSDPPENATTTGGPQANAPRTTMQTQTGETAAPQSTTAPDANPTRAYWGAWIGDQLTGTEAPFDMGAVSKFEGLAGKPVSIVHFAAPFADCSKKPCSFYSFPTKEMDAIRRHGSIPFFSWSSQSIPSHPYEPDFSLPAVLTGDYDSYIHDYALEAKAWGHPFFLRFDWEMNGSWFPWAEGANINSPGEYVRVWRHVHDIFESVGANNVTWVWCPYVDQGKTVPLASVYPGDSYVDWTCLDGYNWGSRAGGIHAGWATFDQIFGRSYRELQQIAPDKPVAIGETGSTESGGSKAAWLAQMFATLPARYPQVRALVYFEKFDSQMDWPIETSRSSRQAFAKGISDPRYVPNAYGSIDQSPIPPP